MIDSVLLISQVPERALLREREQVLPQERALLREREPVSLRVHQLWQVFSDYGAL